MESVELITARIPTKAESKRNGTYLGSGNYGYVYQGVYHGEDVAMKVMNDLNDTQKLRTIREFNTMIVFQSKGGDPHVLKYVDILRKENGTVILVTELQIGLSIDDHSIKEFFAPLFLMHRNAKRNTKDLMTQSLIALQKLHKNNIGYRDMKSSNTILRRRPGTEEGRLENYLPIDVVFVDFGGVCRKNGKKDECVTTNLIFSREGFTAPELLSKDQSVRNIKGEIKADIYSLAKIWYDVIPGKRKISKSLKEMIEAMVSEDPEERPDLNTVLSEIEKW